jgi:hypothetical protein
LGVGRSFTGMPERWKRPVGKYCCNSISKRDDSLRLKTRREIVSFMTSRIRLDAIFDNCGTV